MKRWRITSPNSRFHFFPFGSPQHPCSYVLGRYKWTKAFTGRFLLRLRLWLKPPCKSAARCSPTSTVHGAVFSQAARWEASLETPVSRLPGRCQETGETLNYPLVGDQGGPGSPFPDRGRQGLLPRNRSPRWLVICCNCPISGTPLNQATCTPSCHFQRLLGSYLPLAGFLRERG